MTNLGRGIAERMGLESPQTIAADNAVDAPLNATTAGKVGNVVGNVGATLPAMLIPGVNTVAGGAALGAGLGYIQPTAPGQSVLRNTLLGGAAGGIGTGVGNRISDAAGSWLAARGAAAEQTAALNAERDAVLSAGRSVGLKVPPTAVNPNLVNTALESVSGKAATRQAFQASNRGIFNRLTASDLGLPDSAPLTLSGIRGVRGPAGHVYEVLKGMGNFPSDQPYFDDLHDVLSRSTDLEKSYPGINSMANQKVQDLVKAATVGSHDSNSAVELSKLLRNQSSANFKAAFRSGDPETLELAHAQRGVADAVEDLMGRHLQASGNPELAQELSASRKLIAKSYQAQAALKGNSIDALRLARQAQAGKPLDGGMGLVARFATHFPEVSAIPKSGAGVSKLAFMAGLAGEGGAAYLHSPELAATGLAAMGAPYATRSAIGSGIGQALLAAPRYPGVGGLTLDQLLSGAAVTGRAGLLAAPIALSGP